MKDLSLLVWVVQFGMQVAAPPVCGALLGAWLRGRFGWGRWVVWVGVLLGAACAVDGLRTCVRLLGRLSRGKRDADPPSVSFNDHD